ncbi:sulfurtransferase TusA family protein [Buchnera aphidicola]|uniref:sulfurtransferase TusA family protein n=1 Tax=Buchnera aphidicola TaxID=9 RepID=UPI00209400FA|nr:sulfurtransferase TusA family protein [Buchnera aphidicola]USS94026.1 sulfurtransferase TusA family protein [Buchnera aphidicola (Sipha maydis)]WII23570.1 sulfurtransferase TusA family protein [Buchnera aphidicola (Sipha maydis)]
MKINKKIINLKGLRCPDTMLFLRKKLRSIKIGELILIISDDITMKREIHLLCNFSNYILINSNTMKIPYLYYLKKILKLK